MTELNGELIVRTESSQCVQAASIYSHAVSTETRLRGVRDWLFDRDLLWPATVFNDLMINVQEEAEMVR